VVAETAGVNARTLLVLALVVGALAYLALRQSKVDDAALAERDVPLFEDLDENQVVAVRIENVARDLHMRFERDGRGGWQLTDPLVAPAERTPLDLIVQAAVARRGAVVPADEARDLSKLGLDPPRFVLDVESHVAGGSARQRAEFGAADLDGQRIFVRTRGRVLRVLRDLEPLLDMELHELRSSSVSDVDARDVVELHRQGSVPLSGEGPGLDATLDAVADGGVWRATAPVTGILDPAVMAMYAQSTATYRFEKVFDEGQRSLASMGLDPPELTIRLETIRNETVELVFGRTGTQRQGGWLGTRKGHGPVWEISGQDVRFLAAPVEDFLDHKLVRLRRSAIRRVELSTPSGEVRLVRGPRGWTVESARAGSSVFGPPAAAESGAIEDLIGDLERYELAEFRRSLAWDAGPAPHRYRIEAEDGETGGTFGAPYTDATGSSAVRFQRAGETAVALGSAEILERLARPPQQFLSLRLLDTVESELSTIALSGEGRERRYARTPKGAWVVEGGDVEARELRGVLDALMFLKAREHVTGDARAPLRAPITVTLSTPAGVRGTFTVGRADGPDGERTEVEIEGRRSVLADAGLHARLAAILAAS
jgi:hypothetical protein